MPRKCQSILPLLPEYLDEVLTDRDRQRVEQHLKDCAACRAELAIQREWLKTRSLFLPETTAPTGLNERIMAAVLAEHTNPQVILLSAKRTERNKFWKWQTLTATAAALLLIIAVWQLAPLFLFTKAGSAATFADASDLTGFNPESATGESDGMTTSICGTYRGSGDWLPYPPPEISAKGYFESIFAQDAANFNAGALDGILADAQDIRYFSRDANGMESLIMAAYSQEEIDSRMIGIKNALTPCETPIQIEIIRREDLRGKLDSIDQTLYDIAFPVPPTQSSWIFILIGA